MLISFAKPLYFADYAVTAEGGRKPFYESKVRGIFGFAVPTVFSRLEFPTNKRRIILFVKIMI